MSIMLPLVRCQRLVEAVLFQGGIAVLCLLERNTMQPACRWRVVLRMMQYRRLQTQLERCRRLASSVDDRQAHTALTDMAAEIEVELAATAKRLERAASA